MDAAGFASTQLIVMDGGYDATEVALAQANASEEDGGARRRTTTTTRHLLEQANATDDEDILLADPRMWEDHGLR